MTAWQYGQVVITNAPKQCLVCPLCNEEMKPGEKCVDRFEGVIGFGEKSGQLMVVEDPRNREGQVIVHLECEEEALIQAAERQVEEQKEDEDEKLKFCAGCACKLTGD